ncbi:MAG: hypothetical protein AVDCRST_MAG49-2637 [uncultured Thermomicrobiales bacterium]|uniref:HTH tetR-type domain-containing protein n=1 Tax=uncultured Thermomicrobiales bacterium TaxID=1645740 RepID=A0A6J4UWW0_9BACT|nr:MAG: hypothetical protein AVDCRST_MAG49-2637 [uncultured Thermomicrobiales bacterium]
MPRAGLSRRAVVEAAAALADREGLAAVTLARLAADLGIRTPSLYNHVAGLDDLRQELAVLATRALADGIERAAVGRAGDEALTALALAYRAFATDHPGLYEAHLRAPSPEDPALARMATDLVGIVADALVAYGLRGEDGIHAVRVLRAALHGFVALEGAGEFRIALDRDESFRRLVRTLAGGFRRQAETTQP